MHRHMTTAKRKLDPQFLPQTILGARQTFELVERASELCERFRHRRLSNRTASCLHVILDRFLHQTRSSEVVREYFWLSCDGLRKALLKDLCDAGVELLAFTYRVTPKLRMSGKTVQKMRTGE